MSAEPKDISVEEYNQKITEWGEKTGQDIRSSIRILTSKGKGDLVKSLRLRTAKMYGEIDKLSYYFERHGIFLHKGVGRGYAMMGGKVIRVNRPGSVTLNKGKTNERKVLRLGPTMIRPGANMSRKPVEWYNPIISRDIGKLADLVAEMNADRVVNVTNKILIQ